MELFKHSFKSNKPLEIVALGDIHLGSPECDVEMLKTIVQKIKKRKAKVILMGDLIDLGLRDSPGAAVYEQNMPPSKQVKEIVSILSPIKNQIISSVVGNHEYRLSKTSGIDMGELIATSLECNYGKYQCVNSIKLNSQTYNIFSTHGSGSGQTTESRINSFKKYLEQIDTDIIVAGHCHDLADRIFNKRIVSPNGFNIKSTHLVLAGNFLSWDCSYGEFKGYPILRKGCPLIKLYPKSHKIDVDLNWFEGK